MRTKTRGSRARLSKLPSPTPATRSLPFLSFEHLDEIYEECSIDRTVHEMSSKENKDYGCWNDAVASRYSKNEVDLGPSVDFMDMDLWELEIKTCIRCNKGGDDVLVCSEFGCPVVVHEKCMPPRLLEFYDLEKFYCPYCFYKRENLRKLKSREKAMASKTNLSAFLDFRTPSDDDVRTNEGRDREKELNMLPPSGERDRVVCEDMMVTNQDENHFVRVEKEQQNNVDNVKLADLFAKSKTVVEHQRDSLAPISHQGDKISHGKEKLPGVESLVNSIRKVQPSEQNVVTNHEPEIFEGREAIQEEDAGQVDDIGHETIEDPMQAKPSIPCCVEEENVVDGSCHPSKEGEEEQMHLKASATEKSDSDTEPISMRQKCLLRKGEKKAQPQNVDSPKKFSSPKGATPEKITRSQNVKVTASKKSSKQQASARNFTNIPFANEKRKRQHWKTEEEEVLREAVHKFSTTVNKNLPWRKILEFGRHIFDPTRNPSDLKDKWRNMMAKESSSTSRR
ncbi:hypothetical protein ACOSQ2_002993 [Xanthoceras sorbifolium]